MHSSFSHIGPGYAFGGKRAQVMAKRLAYLKKHGSAWLLRGEAPPAPGYPQMEQVKAADHNPRTTMTAEERAFQRAQVAECTAEGMSQAQTAKVIGKSKSRVQKIWAEIVAEMGWQAS